MYLLTSMESDKCFESIKHQTFKITVKMQKLIHSKTLSRKYLYCNKSSLFFAKTITVLIHNHKDILYSSPQLKVNQSDSIRRLTMTHKTLIISRSEVRPYPSTGTVQQPFTISRHQLKQNRHWNFKAYFRIFHHSSIIMSTRMQSKNQKTS